MLEEGSITSTLRISLGNSSIHVSRCADFQGKSLLCESVTNKIMNLVNCINEKKNNIIFLVVHLIGMIELHQLSESAKYSTMIKLEKYN